MRRDSSPPISAEPDPSRRPELREAAVTAPDRDALRRAYAGRRVLVTGATGFKGSWLSLWLADLGAHVVGFSLPPPTTPSAWDALGLGRRVRAIEGDVRDAAALRALVTREEPTHVFHLAAQPLVRASYEAPVDTFDVNVMGTARLLDALRVAGTRAAVVVVTSDKCYENREQVWGYRECDAMGGHDPYAASKGAAELVVASFRRSFFAPSELARHGVALASARAGNVVGGGDWATGRLVPDLVRALARGRAATLRNPDSVRPWQHVLEPLAGYLALGARLAGDPEHAAPFCDGWNFGPAPEGTRTVRELAERFVRAWGGGAVEIARDRAAPHEASILRLAIERAVTLLGWAPRWGFDETVDRTATWYAAHDAGADEEALVALTRAQIAAHASASGIA